MTPDELRKLADEASPGPWVIKNAGVDGGDGIGGILLGVTGDGSSDDYIETDGGFYGPRLPNARLIALAPDLARLCAELGEALQACLQDGVDEDDVHWIAADPRGVRPAQAALARLEALEKPQ